MSDTPFMPPAGDGFSDQSGVPEALPADQLPSAVDLVTESFQTFMDDIAPFALAGLGVLLGTFVALMVIMTLAFGCLFGGFFVSFAIAGVGAGTGVDEAAAAGGLISALGMMVTYLGTLLVILVGSAAVTGPMNGSLVRAVDEHLRGGPKVGFASPFSTIMKQPVKDILAPLGMGFAVLIGAMAFYVGALFAAFFLMWWPNYVWLDGAGVGEGASRSFKHAKDNLTWHLGVFGLGLAIGMVAGYIPVVGPMFATLYHVKSYRAAYPKGSLDPDLLI